MAEALWVQASGVDYSAAEDRRLISSMWNPGVLYGLTFTAASGLSGTVSAGRCIVSDGAGGCYLCYFDDPVTLSGLSASATNNVYVSINTTTGIASITKGATPTGPYLALGNFVTSATAVTSANLTAATAISPSGLSFVPLSGGTMTGRLTLPDLQVPSILRADASGVFAPKGVRLGGANPTARASVLTRRATAQAVPNNAWSVLHFDDNISELNDYSATTPTLHNPATSATQGRFNVPVAGTFHFSGNAIFDDPSGANVGTRRSRIVQYGSDGTTVKFIRNCHLGPAYTGGNTWVWFESDIDCAAGDIVTMEVYQDQGASLNIIAGTLTAGTGFWGRMRLVQAN